MTREVADVHPTHKPDPSAQLDLLQDWRCFEVLQAGRAERTHHIVGSVIRCHDDREVRQGCVTAALVAVNPDNGTISTEDGQTYRLGRCDEIRPDAHYVWRRWQRAAQAIGVVDVSGDIDAVLRSHGPEQAA